MLYGEVHQPDLDECIHKLIIKNRVREAHRNASSSPELCVGTLRRRLLLLCLGRDELAALVPEVATMVAQ